MLITHGCDSGTTAHIERSIIPGNADPTRTHLNRRLIEYPDGIKDRSAAIQRRLEEAGLTRKIGSNQVRAIRINVSATPEDMERIEREEQAKKRYRKKSADSVRLYADDIMTRLKLKSYQDTYAAAMAKYGLQRGIDGSEARHVSTQQYYRDIKRQTEELKTEVVELQEQRETAWEELVRAKKEIQTERLKGAATTAAANIAESVGSLFGSNKVKTLEKENTALHREVATHEQTIEALQSKIQTMQADHSRQLWEVQQQHRKDMEQKDTEHKKEVSRLTRLVEKLCAWFPLAKEALKIERLCQIIGFDERLTATLVCGKPLEYAGELYSEEHKRKFITEKAGFQVVKDPADKAKLVLCINGQPIGDWFRERFDKLRQTIRRPVQPQRKGRGI